MQARGATVYSAKPPASVIPSSTRFSQTEFRPRLQWTQTPQVINGMMPTRWPGFRSVTPLPTDATSPPISWPRISGGTRFLLFPRKPSRSEPQTPAARTRTTTSPALGLGSGSLRDSTTWGAV